MKDERIRRFETLVLDNMVACGVAPGDGTVIVAISGGADSVALLCALDGAGYNCIAAHCNYHLRGEESNRDMRSVQDLCNSLGVDLYIRDFDVDAQCRDTGESVEMACRTLRYRWFADMLDRQRARCIAVAHHREDNVETFLLNLMRGSSITGLTGMRRRNGYVVRPLLEASRADIEGYLQARGVGYVVDSSNNDNHYQRNKLRNVVLPALSRQFPAALDGILRSIGYLSDNRELYEQAVREKSELYFTNNVIHLAELVREQPLHRLLLFEMLRPMGFNMSQVDDILASADRSGISFSAGQTTLELDRGKINLVGRTRYTPDEVEVSLRRDILSPVNIVIADYDVARFVPERNPSVACFDVSILDGNPRFALRRWRRGDRITPFGMRGTRLLSDIFSDAKMSAADKRAVWILTRDDEIVWVVGIRTTNRYTVTPDSRRYLRLSVNTPARSRQP